MASGAELNAFSSRIAQSLNRVQRIEREVEEAAAGVAKAKQVIDTIDNTKDFVEKVNKSIDAQIPAVQAAEQNPTLRPFATPYKQLLQNIEPVFEDIEEAIKKINVKVFEDPDADGEDSDDDVRLLDLLKDAAETAETILSTVLDKVRDVEGVLSEADATMDRYRGAFDRLDVIGVVDGVDVAPLYAGLNADVETQMGERNALTGDLIDDFNDALAKTADLLGEIQSARINGLFSANVDFGIIGDLFDALEDPLDIALSLLRPLQPLFDAIAFIQDLFVTPVLNFILDTLGLDDLLDNIRDEIAGLVPGVDLFDDFLAAADQLVADLQELVDTDFGITGALDRIEAELLGGVVGNPLIGPTVFGSADADLFLVAGTGDDIIDPRAGDDSIAGGGGNDIVIASEGDDVIAGGAGTDLLVLAGNLDEYEFAQEDFEDDGVVDAIVITHMLPGRGLNEGVEKVLADVEFVSFNNFAFSVEQLRNAIIGASVLNGDDDDNLMFLNSRANTDGDPTTNTVGGKHEANGQAGDDTIFGSTSDDRLFGGLGDDVLIPGQGADDLDGGDDNDTVQELAGGNSNGRVFLDEGTAFLSSGNDTVTRIENALLQGDGNYRIHGDSADNVLTTAGGIDIVTGRGGDDTISTGDDEDLLVGGAGSDILSGGKGADFLLSDSDGAAGVEDFYDGGEGFDRLSYSNDFNLLRNFGRNGVPQQAEVLAALTPGLVVGSVRIFGETGLIERLDADGDVIATDTAVNIESFIGSDADDVIHGKIGEFRNQTSVNGAGGDDIVFADGANTVEGGDGDDLLVATPAARPVQIPGNLIFDGGGGGADQLDVGPVGDARWFLESKSGGNHAIQAIDPGLSGNLRSLTSQNFFFATVENVEIFEFGDFADLIDFASGTITVEFHLEGGADIIETDNILPIIFAGDGDDIGEIISTRGGQFFGEAGADRVSWQLNINEGLADMGSGADVVVLDSFRGDVIGGDGFDTLAFDLSRARIDVDLALNTAVSTRTSGSSGSTVDADVSEIEQVVGGNENDVIRGSDGPETFVGRSGNDTLDGRGGDDKLYGGPGGDTLLGGLGDDLLHGGAGSDTIDGQGGMDTVSYEFAAPSALDGAIEAANFGGVTVNLDAGFASTAQGFDSIINVESAIGGGGDDQLIGSNLANFLSGRDGDDILQGGGGDDVIITGAGNDTATGGAGADTFFIDVGVKSISGGDGTDTLNFGGLTGSITFFFEDPEQPGGRGSYVGQFEVVTPVWSDTGTTEARIFQSVALTPQDVFEAEPQNANSADDLTRVLPEEGDDDFPRFIIREVMTLADASGVFEGIEEFTTGLVDGGPDTGGVAVMLKPSAGVDRFEGVGSRNNALDLRDESEAVSFSLRSGESDAGALLGDIFTGINKVLGGSGDDSLTGSTGDDEIAGGDGADRVKASAGDDDVSGESGDDILNGQSGNDILRGNSGFDFLTGKIGDDKLFGGSGNDQLRGEEGDDYMDGGNAKDRLIGKSGVDVLLGKDANDKLFGNSGDDLITGGQGKDSMNGGAGADIFFLAPGDQVDTIRDFEVGIDQLDISAFGFNDFAEVEALIRDKNGRAQINLDGSSDVVRLNGVLEADLSEGDFILS